jgi:uncharacterized protein YxeA
LITYDNKGDIVVSNLTLILILVVIAIIVIAVLVFSTRCPKCRKFFALVKIKKDCYEQKASHITKKFQDRNKDGKVIRTREVAVPATTYYYKITYKCSYCGFQEIRNKEETKAN